MLGIQVIVVVADEMSMGPSRARVRALALHVLVAAFVASACSAPTPEATLDDSRRSTDTAEAMEVLVDTDGFQAPPTPHTPELIGLDRSEPASLPFLPESDELGEEPSTADSESSIDDGAEPEAEDRDEAGSQPSTSPADASSTGPELPEPPLATGGSAQASYPDPSGTILAASGRPFELNTDGPETQTTRGITLSSVRIGGLVSETLTGVEFRGEACLGAGARFDQANHHAELSRQIDFIGCLDDEGQRELSAQLSALLVRDGVFAITPVSTPSLLSHDFLNAQKVPYLGAERLPGFCGRANAFGFGTHGARGCPVLDARGFVTLVEPVLSAYIASVDVDAEIGAMTYVVASGPDGQAVAASRRFEAELAGIAAPTVLAVLPRAVDDEVTEWDSEVEEILSTSPEVVVLEGAQVEALAVGLREAGYRDELVMVAAMDPALLADEDRRIRLGPVTVVTPGIDMANRGAEGWAALTGAAEAIGVSATGVSLDFVDGYLAADLLVQGLAATPEPLTVEAFADTLNGGWWYPGVAGVSCGNWWPASHFISSPCVSVSRIEPETAHLIPVLGLVETEPQLRFHLGD